jgi:hypothetical protein
MERRIRELEAEVSALKGRGPRGVRYKSEFSFGDLPLVCVATGPDPAKGEIRGHAKGVIAIGDIATGALAIGGFAQGLVAVGGAAVGVITLGGASLGALVAVGGLAIGSLAVGGAALGGAAIGGGAVGYYACGGAVAGEHTVGPAGGDPQAFAFFADYGLEGLCGSGNRRHWRR